MTLLLVFICIVLIYILTRSKELYDNVYDEFQLVKDSRNHVILNFYDKVLQNYKTLAPRTGPFLGSCDDKINEQYELDAVKNAFQNEQPDVSHSPKENCSIVANRICTFTNPSFHMAERTYSPPRWILKSYQTTSLPQHVNINCFNSMYDCCIRSQRNKAK